MPRKKTSSKKRAGRSRAKPKPANPLVIGWRERVDLPDWAVTGLLAKADTGAKSSAIDVRSLEVLPDETVRFQIVLSRTDRRKIKTITAPIHRRVRVRSSNGQTADRIIVLTTLEVGRVKKTIEIGLASRPSMLCRVLLGRTALGTDFVVDPANRFHFGEPAT